MGSQKNRTGLSNSTTTTTTTKQSPTFLAPETSFMEDNFSPAGGKGLFRVTQVHYIYYATADLKGGGAQALIRTMRSNCQYRWNCACSLTAMQPGLNRPWTSIKPWTSIGPSPGGWGSLKWKKSPPVKRIIFVFLRACVERWVNLIWVVQLSPGLIAAEVRFILPLP